jgi:multiple sugar transport system permease protein
VKRGRAKWTHTILSVLLVAGIAVYCLFPLYWILITSFKLPGTEFKLPVEYWPSRFSLESYRVILGPDFRVQNAIKNSLIVSSVVTVGALLICSLSAYAIARLRFRYRFQSLIAIQAAGMVPAIVTIAPTFILVRWMGLLGDLGGMILPNIVYCIPIGTFLMAAYFAGLPFELEDAAKMDGYAPLSIFWKVIMPLAAPGLFAAGVIAFLGSWGEFMLAFTVSMGLPKAQTVPVAILGFSQQFQLQWAWVSAGIVLSLIPVILIVLLFQKWVLKGLTTGALKY